jgi:tetratricopeptide (TPR) repeat protein
MKILEKDIKVLLNLFNTAKFDLVISKSKKLIKKHPEYVILYNLLGSSYQNTGSYTLAKNIFIKGYKMDPTNIAIMNNLANVYKSIGEVELSENLFDKIIKKNPNYINAYVNLGNLKRDNNDFKTSIDLYKKALQLNNKISVTHYSLALAYQGLGNFDLAIEHANKALEIDPKFTQADMLISQSTKYKIGNEHYQMMCSKIKELVFTDDQKVNLLFAIAKAEEDLGQIEKSFKNLEQGNQIKRNISRFNINDEIQLFQSIKESFKNIKFNEILPDNFSDKNIIFILGMPRSGTSLVEQIITSHSKVFGAGELSQLSKIVEENLIDNKIISIKKVSDLFKNEIFISQLKKSYYDYLKRFNCNENLITDKAPLNFRWIGLIKILFPNAKIIHCSRDSKDNCLSLYKNFFEGGLNFSYNQKELVTYYKLYLDLMNFWMNLFPGSIYEANYEKLINNPKDEIYKMIEFCSLIWEDNCIQFHKNKTPIKTMSTAQARKPIYKSSLNSFEKFSPFLTDVNKLV